MKKKSILLMLVVGVVFALFVAPSVALANTWTDITDAQWVEMYGVTAAQVDTVADGYGDGTFGPGNQVTRGQFTKMSVNGLDVAAEDAGFAHLHRCAHEQHLLLLHRGSGGGRARQWNRQRQVQPKFGDQPSERGRDLGPLALASRIGRAWLPGRCHRDPLREHRRLVRG